MAANARSEVGRIVAQKVWSKSIPRTCAQPWTHSRAFSARLRFRLYTHISRTMDLSTGTCDRSMSVQIPRCWHDSRFRHVPPSPSQLCLRPWLVCACKDLLMPHNPRRHNLCFAPIA
eukprot:5458058-Pleurochrysis_carterae.AAC.1